MLEQIHMDAKLQGQSKWWWNSGSFLHEKCSETYRFDLCLFGLINLPFLPNKYIYLQILYTQS